MAEEDFDNWGCLCVWERELVRVVSGDTEVSVAAVWQWSRAPLETKFGSSPLSGRALYQTEVHTSVGVNLMCI